MSKQFRKQFRFMQMISVGLALGAVLAACQPAPTPTPTPTQVPPTATVVPPTVVPLPTATPQVRADTVSPARRAQIRLLVAAPSAPAVDIVVESSILSTRLGFGRLTSVIPILPGALAVRALPSGQPDAPELFKDSLGFRDSQSSLLIFTGAPDTSGGFDLIRVDEDTAALDSKDNVRYTVVNATNTANAGDLKATLGDQELANFSQTGDKVSGLIATGSTSLKINRGGETIASETVPLSANRNYTFIVIPASNDPAEKGVKIIITFTPTQRVGRMRVAHAGPRLPAYDVYLGSDLLASNVTFGKATDWQSFPPLTIELLVYAAGQPPQGEPIIRSQIPLTAETAFTIVIYDAVESGIREAPRPTLQYYPEDLSALPTGQARLTFLHLAPTKQALEVYSGPSLFRAAGKIERLKTSASVTVAEGTLSLGFLSQDVADPNKQTSVEVPASFDVKAGQAYFYAILGSPTNSPPLLFTSVVGVKAGAAVTPTPRPENQARLRLINLLTDPVAVNIVINNRPVFSDVKQNELASAVDIPSGDLQISVLRSDGAGGSTLIRELTGTIRNRGFGTLLLMGSAADPQVFVTQDSANPSSSAINIRFIHAAPGVQRAMLWTDLGKATTAATPRPQILNQATDYLSVYGPYTVRVDSSRVWVTSADQRIIAELNGIGFTLGVRYDVALVADATVSTGAKLLIFADK